MRRPAPSFDLAAPSPDDSDARKFTQPIQLPADQTPMSLSINLLVNSNTIILNSLDRPFGFNYQWFPFILIKTLAKSLITSITFYMLENYWSYIPA